MRAFAVWAIISVLVGVGWETRGLPSILCTLRQVDIGLYMGFEYGPHIQDPCPFGLPDTSNIDGSSLDV